MFLIYQLRSLCCDHEGTKLKKPRLLITFLDWLFALRPRTYLLLFSYSFKPKITGLIKKYCFANFWVLLDGAEKWKIAGLSLPQKTNSLRLCTQKYFFFLVLIRHDSSFFPCNDPKIVFLCWHRKWVFFSDIETMGKLWGCSKYVNQ